MTKAISGEDRDSSLRFAIESRKESRCLSSILFSCQRTDFAKGRPFCRTPPSVSSGMFPDAYASNSLRLTRTACEPTRVSRKLDWKRAYCNRGPNILGPLRDVVNFALGTVPTDCRPSLFQPPRLARSAQTAVHVALTGRRRLSLSRSARTDDNGDRPRPIPTRPLHKSLCMLALWVTSGLSENCFSRVGTPDNGVPPLHIPKDEEEDRQSQLHVRHYTRKRPLSCWPSVRLMVILTGLSGIQNSP